MLTIVKNVQIYAPKRLEGHFDVLIAGNVFVSIGHDISVQGADCTTIDGSGLVMIPGFVDTHVHMIGGGGENGPASRVPEPTIKDFVSAGVTTAIGVLGTDNVSRSPETLLVKARALNSEGMSAFMYTGSYHFPVVTITGNVKSDIVCCEQIVGVGELAISDHRSSFPSLHELARVCEQARIGGMLSGKAGKVHVHMGDQATGLDPLWAVVEQTAIPITQIVPTHLARNPKLLEQSKKWFQAGGWGDITVDDDDGIDALRLLKADGVPMDRVTISSDAFGSLPVFNAQGELIKYGFGKPNTLLECIKKLHFDSKWPLEEILPLITSHPADCYLLKDKGRVEAGKSADFILLKADSLDIAYVYGRGSVLVKPGWVKTGMFE